MRLFTQTRVIIYLCRSWVEKQRWWCCSLVLITRLLVVWHDTRSPAITESPYENRILWSTATLHSYSDRSDRFVNKIVGQQVAYYEWVDLFVNNGYIWPIHHVMILSRRHDIVFRLDTISSSWCCLSPRYCLSLRYHLIISIKFRHHDRARRYRIVLSLPMICWPTRRSVGQSEVLGQWVGTAP